jgi:hypothetical protein
MYVSVCMYANVRVHVLEHLYICMLIYCVRAG